MFFEFNGKQKSNAVALLLLALVKFTESTHDDRYLPTARLLGNYLKSKQMSTGAFVQFRKTGEGSTYTDAEAFYALVRLFLLTHDVEYKESIDRAAQYIQKTYREDSETTAYYSWAMAGFAYMYKYEPNSEVFEYITTVTRSLLDKWGVEFFMKDVQFRGGWSVYVEGLAHVAWMVRSKDADLFKAVLEFVEKTLDRVIELEVNGKYGKCSSQLSDLQYAIATDETCSTTRIDTSQHTLSAAILYLRYLKSAVNDTSSS